MSDLGKLEAMPRCGLVISYSRTSPFAERLENVCRTFQKTDGHGARWLALLIVFRSFLEDENLDVPPALVTNIRELKELNEEEDGRLICCVKVLSVNSERVRVRLVSQRGTLAHDAGHYLYCALSTFADGAIV